MYEIISPKGYVAIYMFLVPVVSFTVIYNRPKLSHDKFSFYVVWIISLLFMAFRPLSSVFTDMYNYASFYNEIAFNNTHTSDAGFGIYALICSQFLNVSAWFALTSLLYTLGYVYLYKTISQTKFCYLYLMLYTSFFFFAYGTNTIRAGLASSLLMYALALYYKKRYVWTFIVAFMATMMHGAMWFPVLAFLVISNYNFRKLFYYIWSLCLVASYFMGAKIEAFLIQYITFDDRFGKYMTNRDEIGNVFRWDFIICGSLPVIWSWYVIHYKQYMDPFYIKLVNLYLATNAFWLLVVRSSFSDRFSYLSWIFIPLIMIIPLIDDKSLLKNKLSIMRWFIFVNCALTIYLYIK